MFSQQLFIGSSSLLRAIQGEGQFLSACIALLIALTHEFILFMLSFMFRIPFPTEITSSSSRERESSSNFSVVLGKEGSKEMMIELKGILKVHLCMENRARIHKKERNSGSS